MTRIADVARRAGVSTATVSRVLNGKQVRDDLAVAVRQAVDELDYSPDRTARSLRRRHSDVIALVLPDIENPFFTSLARGVEDVAQDAGYSVVLCNTDDVPAKEERYLTIAESENMAGVVIAPASTSPRLGALMSRGRGIVVVDRRVPDAVDQVTFDNVGLACRATRDLIADGHTRIACVTGPATTSTAADRAAGWRQAMAEAGLTADDELLVHANFRVDGGQAAMQSLLALDPPPHAVLATNNLVGVGVLKTLAEHSAADQFGVGIIGDLPFATSRTTDISLTPLHPREMGLTAARMLVERIRGLDAPPRIVQPEPPPAPQ
ncbi:LacI family DNA-binding transcriptional regulator [Phytoactinopolyspora limicola]|uniref:LacI family DNA-binding transcriptional regulator n=1 Tax=Phytoactinopolyspora limicola TaxID=2715536 RepID=UPI00140AC6F4|nr:LacI family DNA-binding transcriptional regulator [Phytoactinopolyspora limicola]